MHIRDDAVRHDGRYIVPTSTMTKWVHTWSEFQEAGGTMNWSEDQTEVNLTLPEPYKFGCGFMRR